MRSFITCTLRIYYQGVQVKEDEIGEACSTHGTEETSMRSLMGYPGRKTSPGAVRCIWEYNIKTDLAGI
jgi:hypothetical protein